MTIFEKLYRYVWVHLLRRRRLLHTIPLEYRLLRASNALQELD